MNRIGLYMQPEGGPLSWYSTMKNIKRRSDQDFRSLVGEPGLINKIKNLFSKAQGTSLRQPNSPREVQRPGLLGDLGQASFFSKIQDLFLGKRGSVRAMPRHHYARHPGEGVERPGFVSTPVQAEKPGFIAGYGTQEAGEEILEKTKSVVSKAGLLTIGLAIAVFLFMRSKS